MRPVVTPLKAWPLVRSQLVRGAKYHWRLYSAVIICARRLGLQPQAYAIDSHAETALERQKILRRKYAKVARPRIELGRL